VLQPAAWRRRQCQTLQQNLGSRVMRCYPLLASVPPARPAARRKALPGELDLILAEHGRYDYSALIDRPRFEWPGGKKLAFYVAVNVEPSHSAVPWDTRLLR
jgi:hypothetical protein